MTLLAAALLLFLCVNDALAQLSASPPYTRIPPATEIRDSIGAVWTLGTAAPEYGEGNFQTFRYGVWWAGGIGNQYVYCNSTVYVRGADFITWFRADATAWTQLDANDPCPLPEPIVGSIPDYDVNLTFTLTWQDNSNPPDDEEDEFWIFRNMESSPYSGQPCGPGVCRVGIVGRDVTTFVDNVTKIFHGQDTVCYQVLASNAGGLSPKSEPICGPTGINWQPDLKAPNAPELTSVE